MSRYTENKVITTQVLFTDEGFLNFLKEIQMGCKFIANFSFCPERKQAESFKKLFYEPITIFFYNSDFDTQKCLVSNDDRRKIIGYLRNMRII